MTKSECSELPKRPLCCQGLVCTAPETPPPRRTPVVPGSTSGVPFSLSEELCCEEVALRSDALIVT